MSDKGPLAIRADSVSAQKGQSNYPDPFAARVAGRTKRKLGDVFGLKNFGVNLTTLDPGGESALLHRHGVQDEFVYILEGEAVLRTGEEEVVLTPGMCAGFRARGVAHQLVNRSDRPVTYLEIGDRLPGDSGEYPEDDLAVRMGEDGRWQFSRKAGSPA